MSNRVTFLIDGFNLYHSAKGGRGQLMFLKESSERLRQEIGMHEVEIRADEEGEGGYKCTECGV